MKTRTEKTAPESKDPSILDCLKTFNLHQGYTKKELDSAYKKTNLLYHPDRNSSPEAAVIFGGLAGALKTLQAHLDNHTEQKQEVQALLKRREKLSELIQQRKAGLVTSEQAITKAPENIKALHEILEKTKEELKATQSRLRIAETKIESITEKFKTETQLNEIQHGRKLDELNEKLNLFKKENERLKADTFKEKYGKLRAAVPVRKKIFSKGFVEQNKQKNPEEFLKTIQQRILTRQDGTTATAWQHTTAEWNAAEKKEVKRITDLEQQISRLTTQHAALQQKMSETREAEHKKATAEVESIKETVAYLLKKKEEISSDIRKAGVDYIKSELSILQADITDFHEEITEIDAQLSEEKQAPPPTREKPSEVDIESLAAAYTKISYALAMGMNKRGSLFSGKTVVIAQSPQSLVQQLQQGFGAANETSRKAWQLAQRHHKHCAADNKVLFREIYFYAYSHSGLFKQAKFSGKTFYKSTSLTENFADLDFDPLKKAQEFPQSRTGKIFRALSN